MKRLTGKEIAIDAMILIYLLEKHPKYWEKVARILDGAKRVHMSSLVYGEVLTGFYLRDDREAVENFLVFIEFLPKIEVHSFDAEMAIKFAELRASSSPIPPPDCIHLATAVICGAELFLTNDKDIRNIAGLSIVQLEDVE